MRNACGCAPVMDNQRKRVRHWVDPFGVGNAGSVRDLVADKANADRDSGLLGESSWVAPVKASEILRHRDGAGTRRRDARATKRHRKDFFSCYSKICSIVIEHVDEEEKRSESTGIAD